MEIKSAIKEGERKYMSIGRRDIDHMGFFVFQTFQQTVQTND